MSAHAAPGISMLRRLVEEGPGRVAVVTGERGSPFYCGLERAPSDTLLEAVLTWLTPGDAYDEVFVISGMGTHLPSLKLSGTVELGRIPAGWWFKVPATAANARPTCSVADPDLFDLGDMMKDAGGGDRVHFTAQDETWLQKIELALTEVEHRCGSEWLGSAYGSRPSRGRRCLVLLDLEFFRPGLAVLDDPELNRADHAAAYGQRFAGIPALALKGRADVMLLAPDAATARAVTDGGFIRSCFPTDPDDRPRRGVESMPELCWRGAPLVAIPQVDAHRPYGPYLSGARPTQSLYSALRRIPVVVPPDPLDELEAMVGLVAVKQQVRALRDKVALDGERRRRGMDVPPLHLNALLKGNAGTGKSDVARVLGRIYRELGVLDGGGVLEKSVEDLVAGVVGETFAKTAKVCEEAIGGVLFIDEAGGLLPRGDVDFRWDTIKVLLRYMENYPGRLAVILAGYPHELDRLLEVDDGLPSRIQAHIDFPDYTDDELLAITRNMVGKRGWRLADGVDQAIRQRIEAYRRTCNQTGKRFGNARVVRNLIDAADAARATRLGGRRGLTDDDLIVLCRSDVEQAILNAPGERR